MPSNWTWTTLGEIFTLQAGKNITAKDISAKQDTAHCYPCYGGNGLRGYVGSYNKEGHFPLIGRQGALCGNVNEANGKFYATEHAVVVDTYCKTNIPWVINTLLYLNLNQYATSTAQPGLSVSTINEVMIPVPPLKEQQRISQSIENWFALIDQIGHSKAELQITIKQAKSKILDLAIHGKLVSQDPNDEPAIELMKRINSDFTPCDNGHSRKLPQNWCWAKGMFIFSPMKSVQPTGETFQYIDIDSIDNVRQTVKETKVIKSSNAPSRASRYTQKGDVVFSMVRPYLRNIAKVCFNDCIASTGFYVCSPLDMLHPEFCYYLMISDYVVNGLNQFMKGDNSPSIKKRDIDNWLFPLPPFAEQQRIIAKIEELFSTLDNIQKALEA
ncbi:restriction endonuclease subunit S [Bacteroides sp. ET71]|uniref:restriction endonuclease subunit S n=1 Tax=Bacteroides sp. ET71 TaxID=2939421 RepID=UPI0020124043|nr:restriction endonuclease subunit S [Bacteroides sp. ET71]MCL1616242.1 restriction endonuclease subunit S [Bacteroides sp. ET71]